MVPLVSKRMEGWVLVSHDHSPDLPSTRNISICSVREGAIRAVLTVS